MNLKEVGVRIFKEFFLCRELKGQSNNSVLKNKNFLKIL